MATVQLLEKSSLSDILVQAKILACMATPTQGKEACPSLMLQVIAWVLGEYARLANVDGYTIEDIADLLSECIERPYAHPCYHPDQARFSAGAVAIWDVSHGRFEDPATRGFLAWALTIQNPVTWQCLTFSDLRSQRS